MYLEKQDLKDPRKVNIVRSLMLEKIIRDRQPEQVLKTPESAENGLILPSRYFYLMRSEFIDQDEDVQALSAPAMPKTYVGLLNATQELALAVLNNDRFITHSCMINEDLYFLVCLTADVDVRDAAVLMALQEELRGLCVMAQSAIWDVFRLRLQIWSSDLILGFDELRTEYLNMDDDDLSPLMEKPVMFPEDVAPYLLSPTGNTARRMQSLEQLVISTAIEHDWQHCYRAFRQLIDIEKEHYPIRNHIHDRAVERLTAVFSVGGVPMNNALIPSLRSHVWRKSLQAAVSAEDVDAIVKEVLMTCDELFQPVASVSARVPEIVDFVDKNLFDPNLCADMICDKFGISLSYLSRIFKERQSIKFIDYIHEKRIEASKALLGERDPILTVQIIAERVGYSSALTYTRAFKRIEGMTPGAYRRLQDGNEEIGT